MVGFSRPLLLTAIIAASVACGCAPKQVGRDAGEIVTVAWDKSRDTLTAAARQLAGAATGGLARGVRDSLRPGLDSTLAGLEHSLAAFVATALSDSLSQLLSRNVALLRDAGGAGLQAWARSLAASVRTDLTPALGTATETVVSRAMDALAQNLAGPRLRAAVASLADSVVTQALATIGRESQRPSTRLPWWVWALAIGFGLAVLSLIGLFIVGVKRLRERETSLRLMALAVREQGDPAVKSRVKELAIEHGVEPSLHAFLRDQRLLLPEGPRETA
ncbi:MAG: hypothetical protein ACREMV_09310 [Gemmatimonadales bacterium]